MEIIDTGSTVEGDSSMLSEETVVVLSISSNIFDKVVSISIVVVSSFKAGC